jgi:hypothetical protein
MMSLVVKLSFEKLLGVKLILLLLLSGWGFTAWNVSAKPAISKKIPKIPRMLFGLLLGRIVAGSLPLLPSYFLFPPKSFRRKLNNP